MSASIIPVRAGKLRALGRDHHDAVVSATGLRPVAEAVPGYNASGRNRHRRAEGHAGDIVELLNKTCRRPFADPGLHHYAPLFVSAASAWQIRRRARVGAAPVSANLGLKAGIGEGRLHRLVQQLDDVRRRALRHGDAGSALAS